MAGTVSQAEVNLLEMAYIMLWPNFKPSTGL